MNSRITQRRQVSWEPTYSVFVPYRDPTRGGFLFDCDATGQVCAQQQGRYEEVLQMPDVDVMNISIREGAQKVITPGVMACDCGAPIEMWGGDVECSACGQPYNSAGQALRPQRASYDDDPDEGWHWDDAG